MASHAGVLLRGVFRLMTRADAADFIHLVRRFRRLQPQRYDDTVHFMEFMKVLTSSLILGFAVALPSPIWAAASADIEASGSAPTFCNIKNDGGPIAMVISSEGDKLSGAGGYSYVANGNSKVVLSAVQQTSPAGAAASTPSIALVDLVTNSSSTADASSGSSGGVVRKQGSIAASITQSNGSGLLTAGDYGLRATATCTSL